MRILKEDSIALLIDMQERLFPHMQDKEDLLRNTKILLTGLQILEIPVLVTQQYTRGLGPTIPELKSLLGNFAPFEKLSFSCCDDAAIMQALKGSRKRNILVAGIESHVCILQTSVDLVEAGFQPVVLTDCTSSRKTTDRETAFHRMSAAGAILSTSESLLFELTRTSGNELFKKISALVK